MTDATPPLPAAPLPGGSRAGRRPVPTERVVAVYREKLLAYTEPYIRTQAEAVPGYRSVYVGARRVPHGVELPAERTVVLRDQYRRLDGLLDRVVRRLPPHGPFRLLAAGSVAGRASEAAFKLLGVNPHLEALVRARGPVLVHAHLGVDGAHALPLARRLGLPLVVTFHGFDATATDAELARQPTRGRVYLRRRAAMQREAARIVAVSGFIADLLRARGWPDDRLTVHHMGVDTGLFRPDPAALPVHERPPVVFFAGRLIEKKGLEHLIDALAAARARVPDAELVVAGVGPRRAALERRAAAAGVPVRFLGRVSPDEIRSWLARARLFAMASVRARNGDGEGLPTVIVEAMACGLPVAATAHAGIPEAVADGETGLLAPERDVPALAAHLAALLGDPARCARMGQAGRARALAHFDHRRQAARLAAIYDAVLAGR